MQHTITQQVSITACNTCMVPVDINHTSEYVDYQIEMYRTSNDLEIGALNKYNGKFSYQIGSCVNIIPHLVADPRYTASPVFRNIINDKFLQEYIALQRRQPR